MIKRVLLASGLVVGVLAVACGGDSESGGGGGSDGGGSGGSGATGGSGGSGATGGSAGATGLAIADLPGEIAKAQCALYEKCFGDLMGIFQPGEDCVTRTESAMNNGELSELQAAVSSGKVTYDGVAAAKCLQEMSNKSCDDLLNRTNPNCDQAAEGTVADGGACDYDFDCTGTSFCKFGATCPGTCTARQASGATCDEDDQCQDGLICGDAGSCVTPAADGSTCGGSTGAQCSPGSLCAGEDEQAGTPGTCQPFAQVFVGTAGQDCSFQTGTLCTAGLSCVYATFPPTSGKCETKVASGAACKRLAIPGHCPADEYCQGTGNNPDGTCAALPGAGQSCADTPIGIACAPYTRCENGTCRALQNNGGACQENQTCYSESCVMGSCQINACH